MMFSFGKMILLRNDIKKGRFVAVVEFCIFNRISAPQEGMEPLPTIA